MNVWSWNIIVYFCYGFGLAGFIVLFSMHFTGKEIRNKKRRQNPCKVCGGLGYIEDDKDEPNEYHGKNKFVQDTLPIE